MEPDPDKDYESVIPIHGYTVLKPGSSHVSIGLRNHSCRKVTVQAKSIVAKVSAANVVPHSLAPNLDNEDMFKQFKKYQDKLQSWETTDQSTLETNDPPKLSPEKENLLFSKIDLSGAKGEMEEESKPLTAFTVGPLGFYKCERMPFGLTNTPATFQCLMENCLGELHLSWCIIYLDDIIVFSDDPKEHLTRLRGVFAKLAKAGLKLKPSKCEFFKTKITYLGHIVSSKGIETDPKKIEAVKNWTIPKTVTYVRSFLGFTNHYRRFIRGYANVAKPLNILVSGENANHKKAPIEWTEECQITFDKLKELSTSTPILVYADYKKPFQLQTDASDLGLGAVLYQRDDNDHQRVIAFASHSLSNTE